MIRLGAAALAVAVSLAVTGCGTTSPVQQVPVLEQRLADVDAAATSDDPEALDAAVAALVATVDDAEAADQLEPTHADRIREAAEALLAEVPQPEPPEPEPTRTEEPGEVDQDPDEEPDEPDDDESEGDRGGGKSHDKNKDKDEDKDDD